MILLDTHVAALKEESRLLFSEALPKAYEAHLETVLDKVREHSERNDSLELEIAIRDASNRLSASILKAVFLSLDRKEPWIRSRGQAIPPRGPVDEAGDDDFRACRVRTLKIPAQGLSVGLPG